MCLIRTFTSCGKLLKRKQKTKTNKSKQKQLQLQIKYKCVMFSEISSL